MRTLLLIGLAGLTLAAGAADAQARARIRLGGIRAPASVPSRSVGPESMPQPALSARRDAGVRPTYVLLPPPGSVPDAIGEAAKPAVAVAPPAVTAAPVSAAAAAPAPAKAPAQAATAAAPWCLSGRVVGTGTGFCMIN